MCFIALKYQDIQIYCSRELMYQIFYIRVNGVKSAYRGSDPQSGALMVAIISFFINAGFCMAVNVQVLLLFIITLCTQGESKAPP